MRTTIAFAALAAAAAAAPQGGTTPSGDCTSSSPGKFLIQSDTSASAKRDIRNSTDCSVEGTLTVELSDGKLTDSQGRTGYIAANNQFQFDNPPQPDALATDGWSVCKNQTLELKGSPDFFQCDSGGFFNIYNKHLTDQCIPTLLNLLPCEGSGADTGGGGGVGNSTGGSGGGSGSGGGVGASQIADGQVQAGGQGGQGGGGSGGQAGGGQAGGGQAGGGQPGGGGASQIPDGQVQTGGGGGTGQGGGQPGGGQPGGGQPGGGQPGGGQPGGGQPGGGQAGGGGASQIPDGQIQTGGGGGSGQGGGGSGQGGGGGGGTAGQKPDGQPGVHARALIESPDGKIHLRSTSSAGASIKMLGSQSAAIIVAVVAVVLL
ncbi:uncharacterized protein BP5553_01658 [Venustampulla echinocandica]|uniref:Cell wall mannoprotein PIR1-like C-terminal domain-containing protein n=1 Tax=Venustampulla echinocandica TaxID=2656787 RepID=A0A370U1L8_9HELO|nr:uncharacterized protein BP5553_01658 [Venustampulla echinocandica]RDL41679.1 hypothetical protein BP5553_01658 [Venustampulla echinocandica]